MFNDTMEIQSAKYKPWGKLRIMIWFFNKKQRDKENFKRKIENLSIRRDLISTIMYKSHFDLHSANDPLKYKTCKKTEVI